MITRTANGVRTERFADLEVTYRRAGAGPLVVLIHGLAQDHQMWSQVQDHLSGFCTVAYDLRGHGGTSLGQAQATLSQLGGDLVALLERWGPAVCVGFSLGGTVALWTAAERPELVRGVAALATSSVVGSTAAAGLQRRVELFERGDEAQVREALLADTRMQLATGRRDAESIVAERLGAIGDRAGYVNGARAMARLHVEPLNPRLVDIAAPVLVIGGERDVVCPRRAAEIMLEQLPHAAFTELSGIGHLVTDEDPALVTAALRDWLVKEGLDERR